MSNIDVSDLEPAYLLMGLYNASFPMGMGRLKFVPGCMTVEQAREILKPYAELKIKPPMGTYFDYLQGRVMKVYINGKTLDPRLYDRDCGEGAALNVIKQLREAKTKEVFTSYEPKVDF